MGETLNEGSKRSFLVFSDDYGEHPTSCQHIFKYISNDISVLWVNTVLRAPTITMRDMKKILLKGQKMMSGVVNLSDNIDLPQHLHIVQPPMLPFLEVPGIRAVNRRLVCGKVKNELQKLNMEEPILIVTAPNACDYIGHFNERKVIYYCVDDFSEWPGLDKALVQTMEDELIEKSDALIVTSQDLYDRFSGYNKPIFMLTHGVDLELFTATPVAEHELLQNIPRPRAGYFGLFDDRSDKELLLGLSERMPDVSFVITGDIATDVSKLKARSNVYFTGSIPYKELPSMAEGWDVCIMPYRINRLTDAIQPLKIREYLATGKPVISSPIKEVRKLKQFIFIADSLDKWEEGIKMTCGGASFNEPKELASYLQNESWKIKTDTFLEIVREVNPK